MADRAGDVADARSALMARLRSRRDDAEDRLDRVAEGAGTLLDRAGDPDVQALATFAVTGTFGSVSLADLFGGDGTVYPDSVMQGDPDAYWSTPEARAAQMRADELDNYDGADIGWDDVGEALAFIFADPRECVGDDASVGGCAFEGITLIPLAKVLKLAKLGKYAKKADDAAADAGSGRWEKAKEGYDDANSHGSTGPKNPTHLAEELAMTEVREHPELGKVISRITMTDPRWPASAGWVKMTRHVNGIKIHYVMNRRTGEVDDFKFKY